MTSPGKWDGDDVGAFLFLTVFVGLIGLAIWMIVCVIRADGHVDHCYVAIESGPIPAYVVVGHRSWRQDVTMAAETSSDAAEAKRAIMCPVGR